TPCTSYALFTGDEQSRCPLSAGYEVLTLAFRIGTFRQALLSARFGPGGVYVCLAWRAVVRNAPPCGRNPGGVCTRDSTRSGGFPSPQRDGKPPLRAGFEAKSREEGR